MNTDKIIYFNKDTSNMLGWNSAMFKKYFDVM
jgi:hypothetical protein